MKIKLIRNYTELLLIPYTKKLFIYGIGWMSNFFYSQEYEFLSGFQNVKWIVSDSLPMKEYKGYSVLLANDLSHDINQIIIVATTEAHHRDICHVLEGQGIQECFLLTTEYMVSRIVEEQKRYYDNKVLNVCYEKIPNMGDLLNEVLFEKHYGYLLQKSEVYSARIMGIGSSLGSLFSKNKSSRILGEFIDKQYALHIWGTGFSNNTEECRVEDLVRNNLDICALRGNLSKKRLEAIFGKKISCVVGDPGLLVKELISKESIEKKYKVGIIPHYREIGLKVFEELKEHFQFSKIINLRGEPMKVLGEITACETIISTSLHGAIVADAFEIPNMLVKVSNIPAGDGFKYRDYYSGYGLDFEVLDLKKSISLPTEAKIRRNYLIQSKEVNEKINALKDVMSKFCIEE